MGLQLIWVIPLHRFAVDRAHHIIIGSLLPILKYEMKLSSCGKHSCLEKVAGSGNDRWISVGIELAPKNQAGG